MFVDNCDFIVWIADTFRTCGNAWNNAGTCDAINAYMEAPGKTFFTFGIATDLNDIGGDWDFNAYRMFDAYENENNCFGTVTTTDPDELKRTETGCDYEHETTGDWSIFKGVDLDAFSSVPTDAEVSFLAWQCPDNGESVDDSWNVLLTCTDCANVCALYNDNMIGVDLPMVGWKYVDCDGSDDKSVILSINDKIGFWIWDEEGYTTGNDEWIDAYLKIIGQFNNDFHNNMCDGVFSLDDTVCSGNGMCDGGDCECDDGWGGDYCDDEVCFFDGSDADTICGGNGNCTDDYECECEDGWEGDDCTTEIVEEFDCSFNGTDADSICSGKGNCTGDDECTCDDGFRGDMCEEEKDSSSIIVMSSVVLAVVSIIF